MSSLLIIFIWIQLVHASLLIIWPLSIFQATLLFILTISEVLAFQKINPPSLSPWLFGIGWVGIVGGFIRIHNIRWYNQARKASHEPVQPSGSIRIHNIRWYNLTSNFQEYFSRFQRYLTSNFQELVFTKHILQKKERRDGLLYMGAGFITVVISQLYGLIVPFVPFLPWIILVIVLATLFVYILLYRGFRQLLLKEIDEGSDLIVLPHGSIMYNEKISVTIQPTPTPEPTPTENPTVTAANVDKAVQDDIDAKNKNKWFWFTDIIMPALTATGGVTAIVGGATAVIQYIRGQNANAARQDYTATAPELTVDNPQVQRQAAAKLTVFTSPRYKELHEPLYTLVATQQPHVTDQKASEALKGIKATLDKKYPSWASLYQQQPGSPPGK